jgi:hypothetical protein
MGFWNSLRREDVHLSRRGRIPTYVAVFVSGGIIAGATVGGVALASIPDSNGVIHGCYTTGAGSQGQQPGSTGLLRVIDTGAGQTCKPVEKAISWNQQGPKGDTGQAGPAGLNWRSPSTIQPNTTYAVNDALQDTGGSWRNVLGYTTGNNPTVPSQDSTHWTFVAKQGAQGPQGPSGANNLNVQTAFSNTSVQGNASVVAACPQGQVATGGGAQGLDSTSGIPLAPVTSTPNGGASDHAPTGWTGVVQGPPADSVQVTAFAVCATP